MKEFLDAKEVCDTSSSMCIRYLNISIRCKKADADIIIIHSAMLIDDGI